MAATYYTDEAVIRTTKWPVSTIDVTPTMMTNFTKLAHDVINERLAHRYTVPFTTVPGIIVEVSDLLTVYYGKLYSMGHSSQDAGVLALMRKEAFELLDLLASGTQVIPGVATLGAGVWGSWGKRHHRVMDRLPVVDLGQDSDEVTTLTEDREGE